MSKEKERLGKMLKEGKISEEDYSLLLAAIEKNSSRAGYIFSILLNPFQKIAGFNALILGLIVILAMSFLGVAAKLYFPGILGVLNATVVKLPKIQMGVFLPLCQNIISWLTLTFLFFISAKIFQQKKLRFLDFLGTVALSRFPYLILTLSILLSKAISPGFMDIDLSKGLELHPSIGMTLFGIFFTICALWQIITYFYALKESSGLIGKKLWISFLASIIIGEAISSPLTTIFF